jgi:dihydroxy-acid dehydratase
MAPLLGLSSAKLSSCGSAFAAPLPKPSSCSSSQPPRFADPKKSPGIRANAAPVAQEQRTLNKYSSRVTQPKSQGGSQAILYGVGLSDEDLGKPQVGISSVWYEGNTCNMHLLKLSEKVKEGVEEAGLVGFRFNTIGVSDAISMGTEGMSYSLQSRDLIADSIETVMGGQWYDANISIPGCDKNVRAIPFLLLACFYLHM